MAKTKNKSKAKAAAKKPLVVSVHGETIDLELELRDVGDYKDDLSWYDQFFEKISKVVRPPPFVERASDITPDVIKTTIEVAEKIGTRIEGEPIELYRTNMVAIGLAFVRNMDDETLASLLVTLSAEQSARFDNEPETQTA